MKLKETYFVVFTTIFISCSLFEDDSLKKGVYEGLYVSGFEVNSFSPCIKSGNSGGWWVTGGSEKAIRDLDERYQKTTTQDYEPVYVRLEGKPSQKGSYGHKNSYEREFEVAEVLELRKSATKDCE